MNNPDNIRGSVIRVEHYGPWLLTFDVSFLIRADGRLEDVEARLRFVDTGAGNWWHAETLHKHHAKFWRLVEEAFAVPDQELYDQWAAERERAGARA